ncbi:hypothetical protein L210DRAFT_2066491 [Boletus edulis BED1]|uniref:Uncharacterized protein n=1 Tax=Boletus edulis BED1 TaxID=1328754 RepID=A0AAD4GFD6_BOLED|nr:hypothetical protein L210DRAFT_2066491 [Boletus edulis BED1]
MLPLTSPFAYLLPVVRTLSSCTARTTYPFVIYTQLVNFSDQTRSCTAMMCHSGIDSVHLSSVPVHLSRCKCSCSGLRWPKAQIVLVRPVMSG